ncbi:MAG: hypothetical protein EBR30_19175 [Cytophagia bacterium]|jgi:hypothetical protein|nr:hypothetical protein [Cytophagia bacterium]
MALWGNNDNKGSGGTVTLDYTTLEVVGSGTTFGQVGAAATGDVIRFGTRGGGGTYFGDAVIVGIASTTSLSIASTTGLSGAAIAGAQFYISELPKYTVLDSTYSNANDAAPSLTTLSITGTATTTAGIGTNIIPVVAPSGLVVGDILVNGASNIKINTINATTISLASTIASGISTGDTLTFKRFTDGYDKQVYGIDITTEYAQSGYGGYAHSGWVGVTTYVDCQGNFRVKTETLVAMSGITTGTDGILYPTPV